MRFSGIHVISDRALTGNDKLISVLVRAAEAGASAIHLRERDLSASRLFAYAVELRTALPPGVLLVVNDRIDVALAAGADGVQLGSKSIPVIEAKRLAGGKLAIGASVHYPMEAAAAEGAGADYVILGTIYKTASHPGALVSGPDHVRAARELVRAPIIAIGGITPDRAAEVRKAGADGVAVIRGVLAAADPSAAVRAYLKVLG